VSRARRWLLRLALAVGAGLLLFALGLAWLLGTESGARFTLARSLSALPTDSLGWTAQQGSLAQGLRLQGLRYRHAGIEVDIERLYVRASLTSALRARLHIEDLQIDGLRLRLPASAQAPEPAEPFAWNLPESLPALVLPIDVELVRAELRGLRLERVADGTGERLFEADQLRLAGRLEAGRLSLSELRVDAPQARIEVSGEIDSVSDWRSALDVQGEWRAPLAAPQPFALRIEGPLQALALRLRLPDTQDFALDLDLYDGLPRPQWRLQLNAPTAPAALADLWPARLGALALQGEGGLDRLRLSGDFELEGRDYRIEALALRAEAATLQIDEFLLVEGEGRARLQGSLRLPEGDDTGASAIDLQLEFERFALPLPEAPPLRLDGGFTAGGALDDARLDLDLALARGDLAGELRGGLLVQGDTAQLEALELRSGEGRVQVSGELDWRVGLAWQLDAALTDFDAALLLPSLPSRLSARLRSRGEEGVDLRRGELALSALEGSLRGQAVGGEIDMRWNGLPAAVDAELPVAEGSADLDLRWGASALTGRIALDPVAQAQGLRANLRLQPLQLEGLIDGAAGEVRGRLSLSGTAQAPRLALDLDAEALALAGLAFEQIGLQGELGLSEDAPLQLDLKAVRARLDGRALGAPVLSLRGSVGAHTLDLRQDIEGKGLSLQLSGGWREREQRWLGRVQQLDWRARGRRAAEGDWALGEAVALEVGAQRIKLDLLCLDGQRGEQVLGDSGDTAVDSDADRATFATAGEPPAPGAPDARRARSLGSFCLAIDGAGADDLRASLSLEALPLALPMGLLIEDVALRRPRWRGTLGGEVEAFVSASGWRIDGRLSAPAGSLRMGEGEGRELLQWRALELAVAGDAARLRMGVTGAFGEGGNVDGEVFVDGASTSEAQLQGRLSLLLDQLGVIEYLSEEALTAPTGRLSAEIAVRGPLAAPELSGGAALSAFSVEIPALGIAPREGRIDLRLDGSSAADLEFAFRSEGELSGRGRIDWSDAAVTPLQVEIGGSEVLVSDTPQLRLVASPALELSLRDSLLRLRGRVDVPRAEVRLDRFEGSQQVSADVVVLDPAQPERAVAAAQRIDADIRLALGEDVKLAGFGLNGTVSGELRLRDRPGRATHASGSLNVGGRYKAYGQDLDITRGRLSFAQSPLDNPGLDIRAQREYEQVTVGIRVTGTAVAPVLGLWSQPSLDQADVLSYLVLGRPVRAASGGEGQQLNAAAAALGAGGNYIAERLGARLGFDQASVEESAALGGAALMLGKFLSPRLYVAYGVALFGEGQVFSIKYLLSERWDVEVEASDRETRGSVNYRLER
jgi:translocation and assembly module TamB